MARHLSHARDQTEDIRIVWKAYQDVKLLKRQTRYTVQQCPRVDVCPRGSHGSMTCRYIGNELLTRIASLHQKTGTNTTLSLPR